MAAPSPAIGGFNPHRIILNRQPESDGDIDALYPLGVAATPGMLAEYYSNGGVFSLRPHSSATLIPTMAVFLPQTIHNKGIDDVIPIGDYPTVEFLEVGDVFFGLIPSGQDIVMGDYLQSNGDGKLKEATASTADAGLARFQCVDVSPGAVTADTRVRARRIS